MPAYNKYWDILDYVLKIDYNWYDEKIVVETKVT